MPQAIFTIYSAEGSSIRSLYDCKWKVFEEEYTHHRHLSSARLGRFCLFFLALVLEGLKNQPFELLQRADLKLLSRKTVLLLALASAKPVGYILALWVYPLWLCMEFIAVDTRMILKPNPAPDRGVMGCIHCFTGEERMLTLYLAPVVAPAWIGLFVSWAGPHKDRPLTKRRLSPWQLEVIALAYLNQGLKRAHSTWSLATPWALFQGWWPCRRFELQRAGFRSSPWSGSTVCAELV